MTATPSSRDVVHPSLQSQWVVASGDDDVDTSSFPTGTAVEVVLCCCARLLRATLLVNLIVNSSFPGRVSLGLLDVNGQQIDLRSKNSWVMKIGELVFSAMLSFVICSHHDGVREHS